jgi:hypothetical protein
MKVIHDKSEIGQGMIEYILIFAGMMLVAILALSVTGTSLNEVYCQAAGAFGAEGCGCVYTFDDTAALDDWDIGNKDDQLSIEDGKLCHSGTNKAFVQGCTDEIGDSDYTVNLNGIEIEQTGSGNTGFDFFFRVPDPANGYHFTYNSNANRVVFWKRVDWKWIQLSSTKVPTEWGNEELNFQIKVEGDTFTAYKDGQPILQASDDAYPAGDAAFRNKPGSKTCVDGISIQQSP